jgi:hypothetical protein
MVEHDCLFIKNPSVVTNFARNQIVERNDKLNLNYKTTVIRCNDFGGSLFGFDFTAFDLLASNRIPQGKIIGELSLFCCTIGLTHTLHIINYFLMKVLSVTYIFVALFIQTCLVVLCPMILFMMFRKRTTLRAREQPSNFRI